MFEGGAIGEENTNKILPDGCGYAIIELSRKGKETPWTKRNASGRSR